MLNSNKITSGPDSINAIAGRDVHINANVPTELIDEKITEKVKILRKSRFFQEFDSKTESLRIGTAVLEGDFAGGSNAVKSWALTWCIRLLASLKDFETAEKFLHHAKALHSSIEIQIAEAFILSHNGDQSSALKILARRLSENSSVLI